MIYFLHGYADDPENESVGMADFGATTTTFALFNKGLLSLVRRFSFGNAVECKGIFCAHS